MSTINIDAVLTAFDRSVSRSLSLANDSKHFLEPRGVGGTYLPILKRKQYQITELSFLQIFVSWEQFLEHTFIRYMCGGQTSSGYSPRRLVQPPNLNHALGIVLEGKSYADWTRVEVVIRKAESYFANGEPYKSVLGSASTPLEDMKKIRNRIAHRSAFSERQFRDMVRQRLGHNPWGMNPGRFLLHPSSGTPGQIFLQQYTQTLLTMGRLIVR